jgi:hypothetical protein
MYVQHMDTQALMESIDRMDASALVSVISATGGTDRDALALNSIDQGFTQILVIPHGRQYAPEVSTVLGRRHVEKRIGIFISDEPHMVLHWLNLAQVWNKELKREEECREEEIRTIEREESAWRAEERREEEHREEERRDEEKRQDERRKLKLKERKQRELQKRSKSSPIKHPRRSQRSRMTVKRLGDLSL